MNRRDPAVLVLLGGTALLAAATYKEDANPAVANAPADWSTASPRDEIRPAFAYEPDGGPGGKGAFLIQHDRREGLDGSWMKTFPIQGGKYYAFKALCKMRNVALPRRSVVVKLNWRDADGKKIALDEPAVSGFLRGATPMAETEFPAA